MIRRDTKITAGPSREDLFDALRLRHEGRKVAFKLFFDRDPNGDWSPYYQEIVATIDSIGVEDGGGQSWLLTVSIPHYGQTVSCYYNSTNRNGYMKPIT